MFPLDPEIFFVEDSAAKAGFVEVETPKKTTR
jgi:hypothetical protein